MSQNNVPKHISIILDGNRRYAKSKSLPIYKGHYAGAERVENLMNWANELGVKELTLYSFSMQNFKRPKEQVSDLMKLFELFFKKVLNKLKEECHKRRLPFEYSQTLPPRYTTDSFLMFMTEYMYFIFKRISFLAD